MTIRPVAFFDLDVTLTTGDCLRQFLGGSEAAELTRAGQRSAAPGIATMLRAQGIERLRWHQAHWHARVLVGASLDLYLAPWAQAQGLLAALTSARVVDAQGSVGSALRGANCYGEEKVARVDAWRRAEAPLAYSCASGDTCGDLPLLHSIDEGFLLAHDGHFRRVWPRRGRFWDNLWFEHPDRVAVLMQESGQFALDQAFQLAIQHHQRGRFTLAHRLYPAILYASPDHPLEMHNLALAHLDAAGIEHAVGRLRRVVADALRALTTR